MLSTKCLAMTVNRFQDLIVWQRGMQVVDEIYLLTKRFPSRENFVLSSQKLRSAISVPSNIAEGFARNRKLEFIRFLEIAFGSSCELETQLLISKKEYPTIPIEKAKNLNIEVQKMLRVLISKTKH